MPKVQSSTIIKSDLDKVYQLAKDVEKFPEFMPDVKSVKILEEAGNRRVSEWVGYIKQFARTVKWTEEDFWDDDNYICKFKQLEGDFHKYEGVWKFERVSEGTKTDLEVEFEYSVPLIGPLIQKVITVLMQKNCDSMLSALKNKAEAR